MKPADHRSRYEGKNLAVLLLAICLPAALLYLRLVFGMLASDRRFPRTEAAGFSAAADAALVLFFGAQLWAALHFTRLFPGGRSRLVRGLLFIANLALGIVMSLTGTVILEAFGYNFLVRAGGLH